MKFQDVISKNLIQSTNGLKYKKPGPKTPPDFISERAKAEWPIFYKKHGAIIREKYPDDLKKKWAFVKIIFTNYCSKLGIPFEDPSTAHLDMEVAKSLQQRFYNNRDKITNKAEMILRYLFDNDMITRIFKERIDAVYYDEKRSMWRMISTIPIKLTKDVMWNDRNLVTFIKDKGFKKSGDKFELTIGTQKIQLIEGNDDNPEKMYLKTVLNFTPQHIRYIFKLSEKDLKDKKTMNKKVKAEFKKLLYKKPLLTII